MSSIDAQGHDSPQTPALAAQPHGLNPKHAEHFRSHEDEFDATKIGMWLFLTTEVLLFAGLFCFYAVFRMLHPEAFVAGSKHLDVHWGAINTAILLLSSFTIAYSIRNAQTNNIRWLKINLLITIACGFAFLFIKLFFEYIPKWGEGKRPGKWFDYAFATHPHEHMWWSVYYVATSIHALHVIIGMSLIFWMYLKARKGFFGPKHYTGVEVTGLYWHLVDLIWIFLFPLLYLIH